MIVFISSDPVDRSEPQAVHFDNNLDHLIQDELFKFSSGYVLHSN